MSIKHVAGIDAKCGLLDATADGFIGMKLYGFDGEEMPFGTYE